VRAVIAESFERIHRSNLVGMGVAPLQFLPGQSVATLGLSGEEIFDIIGLVNGAQHNFSGAHRQLQVTARKANGETIAFPVLCRIDTPQEVLYYRHGGILPYVLRQLLTNP
jgi:aconitate hydratase